MNFTEPRPFILIISVLFVISLSISCVGSGNDKTGRWEDKEEAETVMKTGAEQTDLYYPLIQGKKAGLVANHTSIVEQQHLLDMLVQDGIQIIKAFGPEHGFRGDTHDGGKIEDDKDPATGVTIISLYGKHRKPTPEDLAGLEVMIFDIQDVGVRFYTYISTLSYVMEACAEAGIPVIVLDRPNPNGFYIDGPVLQQEFSSFIGLHPIPIVYGMTIGEYAKMVNGEGWMKAGIKCELTVIPLEDYDRKQLYRLPIRPSPNLPNWKAVYLYPSLALFEGTFVSVGRGTDFPFQVIGHPDFAIGSFTFKPESRPGASLYPKHEGEQCFGQNLTGYAENIGSNKNDFTLGYLIGYYDFFKNMRKEEGFFKDYFEKLVGNGELRKQIEEGWEEEEIRATWEDGLQKFKDIRAKYLIYGE